MENTITIIITMESGAVIKAETDGKNARDAIRLTKQVAGRWEIWQYGEKMLEGVTE